MVIRLATLALLAAIAPAPVTAAAPVTAMAVGATTPASSQWVGSWASAQVAAGATGWSHNGFSNETLRDIVHLSVGGSEVRIRISNVFGTRPLRIADVRVAQSLNGGSRTVPGTSHRVMFGRSYQVTIPAGRREFSDPVAMRVGAGENLAVSIFVKVPTGPATWHPAAIATSYYSTAGDHSAAGGAAYPHKMGAWCFLDGVDVVNPAINGAVVTFGASTSDGVGSTLNANERYPDDLAHRLLGLPAGLRLSVLNEGISGNQLLADGTGPSGPSGLNRFARDALGQTGVRVIIVWEGTNDIGEHPDMTASQITNGYLRLIAAAHARGIAVVGATLQPDEGAGYYSFRGNRVRQRVNRWIRDSSAFDAVADFDEVLRDPADPAQMLPAYDSGDHLHPNDAGYQAIANSLQPWVLAGLAIGYLPSLG